MAKIGSWGYDKQTDTNFWSDAVHQIYGTDPKEGVPELDVILCCFNEDSRNKLLEATRILATKGVPFDIELQMTNLKNEERWIRNIGEPIYNNKNKIIGRRGVSQDITEQQLTRNKIEKTEEMYRLLADNSNDLIFLQEPDSTFQYVSPSIINILGYEQSDILDKKVFDFLNKDDVEPLKKAMKKGLFRVKLMDAYTLRVRHKEGHFVWLEFLTSPTYKDKKNTYFITSARDVTRMMLAKQEIQEYQTSLQRLTTEITLIEEKQKKEIASNIHDHLSQSLVVSKMKINELKKNPSLKVIENDLRFIETHISEALENTRKITYELSPPVLYQLGIIDALSWLLDDVEATHKVPCRLNSNVDNLKLSDVKSILLYRSIQEVINNAIKYGNASLITLKLDKNKLGLDILLTDNGVGFDTSLLKNHQNHSGSGFGLFTVQERIRNIQGRFTIASEINKGTVIKFFIPLSV
jgi:PAS domain S-box-containing protein